MYKIVVRQVFSEYLGFSNCPRYNNSPSSAVYRLIPVVLVVVLRSCLGPWPHFQFFNPVHSHYCSFDGGSASLRAVAHTQDITNTYKHKHTSVPRVRFELTTPVFERAKAVYV